MPTKTPWVWNESLQRYRSTETGRFLGPRQMLELRDVFAQAQRARTSELAARLTTGEITATAWQGEMKGIIKQTYIDQYVMAKGGRAQMTQADYGRLGNMLRDQYKYLQGFESDIKAGKLSPGQIAARANLYVESSTQAYERGRAAALGVPKLPAYPGDGSTQCRSNCRCHWEIVPTDGGWDCFWRLGDAQHCSGCQVNAGTWSPLQVSRP